MEVTYLGHSAFQVVGAGVTIYVDPFITGNPKAPYGLERLPKADYIFVTHGHADHVGDTVALAKRDDATVITTFEFAEHHLSKQGVKCHDMGVGGTYNFPFGKVRCTVAFHDSGVAGGNPAGFIFHVGDKVIYHAGDTALFSDMKLLGELEPIDLALLPIGGNYTMDRHDAVLAAKFLGAKTIIPMHYNTFPVIETDVEAFAKAIEAQGQQAVVLNPGETYAL